MEADACSLNASDLQVRLVEFRDLLARAVSRERTSGHATFWFRREDEASLRDLARRERSCCSFWIFEIERRRDLVSFNVGVVSPRFEPFVDGLYELARS